MKGLRTSRKNPFSQWFYDPPSNHLFKNVWDVLSHDVHDFIIYVDYAEDHLLVTIDLGDDDVVDMDHEEHRLVRIDLGVDDVVHVDYEEHRLVTKDFGDDDIVHVDCEDHRWVTIDLEDDDVVHVD